MGQNDTFDRPLLKNLLGGLHTKLRRKDIQQKMSSIENNMKQQQNPKRNLRLLGIGWVVAWVVGCLLGWLVG